MVMILPQVHLRVRDREKRERYGEQLDLLLQWVVVHINCWVSALLLLTYGNLVTTSPSSK